ncbi:MAG: nitrous oxide-stimulated promoter family protein [Candidatus Hydrogenedentes bacterium]|nr:nitrous oxide-stimulated promoter family protein [Candidatus Hydrogenedentota bacterium]
MVKIYCKAHHDADTSICDECRRLLEYSEARIRKCPQIEHKPPCRECAIHCFAPEYREQTRRIMRFAGPRMIWRHPLLAIRHLMKKPVR